MATSLGWTPLARSASPAAPVPRPPHPTSTIWTVELPAAWTVGTAIPARAETAAAAPTRLPSSRREIPVFSLDFMSVLLGREMTTAERIAFHGPAPMGTHVWACY